MEDDGKKASYSIGLIGFWTITTHRPKRKRARCTTKAIRQAAQKAFGVWFCKDHLCKLKVKTQTSNSACPIG